MKKNNLLKAIFIICLLFIIGSWLLPASTYSTANGFSSNGFEPVGILDLLFAPFQYFNWGFVKNHLYTDGTTVLAYSYVSLLLVIITTGAFYGVLNKTGAYGHLIEDVSKKAKKKREFFFLGTAIFFLLFSAIVGVNTLAFVLIPFFATILLKLDYSKISVFGATFLTTLLGSVISITGSDVVGISNIMYGLDIQTNLVFRVLCFLLVMVITCMYLLYKKEPAIEIGEEKEEITVSKNSYTPIVVISVMFFLIFMIGCFNWYYVLDSTAVTDMYETVMSTSIGSYPITSNLFGMMEPFGYWTGFTISGLLLLLSIMIGFVYCLSFDTMVDGLKSGAKKMLRPTLYVILASVPMVMLINISNSNFLSTIVGFIYSHVSSMAVPFVALATIIYGIFVGDYFAIASLLSGVVTTTYQENLLSLAILTMQMIHGLVCVVAPTSAFLVAGLSYLKIPYKKWLAYIWKLVGILLLISLALLLLINVI